MEMPRKKPNPKPRRPKGSGSIIKRGNRFYGRIREAEAEILTIGCESVEEAERALSRLLGGEIDPRLIPSLQSYWGTMVGTRSPLEGQKTGDTLDLYETILTQHVERTPIGRMSLADIRKMHCQRWVDGLYKKGLKEWTVKRYGSALHVILEQAVLEGILTARLEGLQVIPANPATGLQYRSIPDSPCYILTDEELTDVPRMMHGFDELLAAMVTVMIETGCRPGELCAMTTSDINHGVWTISATRNRNGNLTKVKAGKIRHVALSDVALSAIEAKGARKGSVWVLDNGNPTRPDWLAHRIVDWFDWAKARAEREDGASAAPKFSSRDLRKTFITRGCEIGMVKQTQKIVGHSTSKMTLDVYAKSRKDAESELVKKLAEATQKRSIFAPKGTDRGTETETTSRVEAV